VPDATSHPEPPPLRLVSVCGPADVAVDLPTPTTERIIHIGRLPRNEVRLDDPAVSRTHALITGSRRPDGSADWTVADADSKHGTRLDGVPLVPHRRYPLRPGDLIEVGPWTLAVSAGDDLAARSTVQTIDDEREAAAVAPLESVDLGPTSETQLRLLLECAEQTQEADDLQTMATVVLDAATAGTGMPNAALLRPMRPDGSAEILARAGDVAARPDALRLSRTLVREAQKGAPVQMNLDSPMAREAVSIIELGVQRALCVPLRIGSTLAGLLYLDERGATPDRRVPFPRASAFALGLARLASLSMANLMRRELERRHAQMQGELEAAARTQQLVLPPRQNRFASLQYSAECRPGRLMSGDFFEIVPLDDDRVAVAVGDVTGKGIPASVLMTSTQGFLNAALRAHRDPAHAVRDINAFLCERCQEGKFVTLWLGLFDTGRGRLEFVNAGHGYALRANADNDLLALDQPGGPPLGILADASFEPGSVELAQGDRVVIVSDGIVEQCAPMEPAGRRNQFGLERLAGFLVNDASRRGEVAALFDALIHFAGTEDFADDATAVLVNLHP
jgi:serine phosphatase RsbU (regulator of sigma subunit)